MLSLNINRSLRLSRHIPPISLVRCNFSSDDHNDKEKNNENDTSPSTDKKIDSSVAKERLNKLLLGMTQDDSSLAKAINIVKASGKQRGKERARKDAIVNEKKDVKSKTVSEVVRDVAKSFGRDEKQTESELLLKLLSHAESSADGDQTILGQEKSAVSKESMNLSDLLGGMKIDRQTDRQKPIERELTRGEYVKKIVRDHNQGRRAQGDGEPRPKRQSRPYTEYSPTSSVQFFSGPSLGIFADKSAVREVPDILPTWELLEKRELKLSVTHPPVNYFEKMVLWTEQGKFWAFPIDNEQGLEDEKKIDFTEHVFLEKHLEGWCPSRGPIRHFMELVCVGLSKNPYITAKEKQDHILWYRDYFEEKKDVLKDLIIEQNAEQPVISGGVDAEENK